MQKLLQGFLQFRDTAFRDHAGLYQRLAVLGQSPRAAVVACCDSRVDPQLIFQAAPGDLFIIRNVANLVPPYQPNADYHGTSAALEFAVRHIGVRDIIVMGHTLCGGVSALMSHDGASQSDFIGAWMSMAREVRDKLNGPADQAEAEQETIRLSLRNLATFPWISERVAAGQLNLHGCLFDVAAADLLLRDPLTDVFTSVTQSLSLEPAPSEGAGA